MDSLGFILVAALLIAVAIVSNLACAQIPGEGRAVGAAENLGLTDVKIESRSPAFEILGGCKDDDVTKFKVSGVGADGKRRQIQVCAPLIGGYTVRN